MIPIKEDSNFIAAQPLVFKLHTSIISKLTLKKISVSTCLYEVTTIPLDVELPISLP